MTAQQLIAAGDARRLATRGGKLGQLIGAARALALVELASTINQLMVVVARDPGDADQLEAELRWFAGNDLAIAHFVEWETLPYDSFSPHQDIVSSRLQVLAEIRRQSRGIVVVAAQSLLQRLPPLEYVASRTLSISTGDAIDRDDLIQSLTACGYLRVPEVSERGEYAVRGSLLDVYPMGGEKPLRVDFFDDEVDTLRHFSADTQLSAGKVSSVNILPGREIPLDAADIRYFKQRYRERFEGRPSASRVYQDVSAGILHGGIEYYLPLFFPSTANLLEYLPEQCCIVAPDDLQAILAQSWQDVEERFDLCRLNPERPVLDTDEAFFDPDTASSMLAAHTTIAWRAGTVEPAASSLNVSAKLPPAVRVEARYDDTARALHDFVSRHSGRLLFVAESPGQREQLLEFLNARGIHCVRFDHWQEFVASDAKGGIVVSPLSAGVVLSDGALAIVTNQQLFGETARQSRRRKRAERDPDAIIRQLNDLQPGSPVVHAEYGVGRYRGLIILDAGGVAGEFLHLEYADGDKLYVPVHALDLVTRYTGAAPDNAPLHRLGSDQWAKARRRAMQKIRDAAAELLDIYARRAARPGHRFNWPESEYRAFEAGFPFELTKDQARTIEEVLDDLRDSAPMDRVVCGDVGFGKTEVALRASFAAVQGGRQVAILVPTTLLAAQHGQTFRDRFADWPVRVEVLSRFCSAKEAKDITDGLQNGKVDIVIGTHRLLQHTRQFNDVGLVIIDEEHRFGVRHKEAIKALRSEIDVLTLTATPIPRTLNMALGGVRELSLITTPPAERLSVKTFVSEWNDVVIREACLREIKRGGQVYFIHNRVEDIGRIEESLQKLVPEANIRVGHGQMRERDLEQVMLDFYHRRFNVLLCTTIVESGIDVPTANTIIINRADRFGLAQLHQLRGRVGRSHHRAYAYLVAPPRAAMTADAVKRLEAIDSLEDLGSGFTLATHDLEIRGAGELLGETQSGQIQEIGFALYQDMLERTVAALKRGETANLDKPLDTGVEINLHVPALLPEDYVPDVHLRLILYKRIASAESAAALRDLQVELIDRFGLLPEAGRNYLRLAALKRRARALGITKLNAGDQGGYLQFGDETAIDPAALVRLVQEPSNIYRLKGAHRLQFQLALTTPDERFRHVEDLLENLSEQPHRENVPA